MKLKKLKADAEDLTTSETTTPQAEIIEADQYKCTYYGPDIPTLELECWEEELSEYQLAAYKTADEEYKSIQNKLEAIVKDTGGEVVYNGDQFTAYQLLGKQPALKDLEKQSAEIIRSRSRSLSVSKEPKDKGKRGRPPKRSREEDRDYTPARSPSPEVKHKKKKKDKEKHKEKEKDKENTKTKDKTLTPSNVHSVVTNVRPSEATAIGGLSTGNTAKTTAVVDLTKDDGNPKTTADSKEVSFNKLQGKTFPSLVVIARPYLRAKDAPTPSDRAILDSKVKSVLMYTPTKFTEWLLQQGLVRAEQWCAIHTENKLKLGMYSDISKFPYSGGYVWISECCPARFISVFCSSIFEGATHPPSVILKLIYHWACQTNVQNVVQWVKVDNLYVKSLFTWLRAVCTAGLHEHMGLLGGPGKKVEVGVISLGTTSHDGTQRQVKVEVLGVLDVSQKLIRLRAVEPLSEQEKNYKKRFQKILEPLTNWVQTSSTIVTDLTVDKGTLVSMGFKTVQQSSQSDTSKTGNSNIMEYLRRIVPRMFQNTLSLLSRQIIQQFLDELVWREKFGVTPGQAFDNIVLHLAQQTKVDAKENITVRLNKIAANPFKSWKYPSKKEEEKNRRGRKKREPTPPPPPPTTKREKKRKVYTLDDDDDEEIPLAQRRTKVKQEKEKAKEYEPKRRKQAQVQAIDDEADNLPLKAIKKEQKEQKEPKEVETVSLEKYYYGQFVGAGEKKRLPISVDCPVCHIEVNNNCDLMKHLYTHVVPSAKDGSTNTYYCIYCLSSYPKEEDLTAHLKQSHPVQTKVADLHTYSCLICETRVAALQSLANHMQKAHAPLELAYKCEACGFRASAHKKVIDHFYSEHARDDCVQCPRCLKVISVYCDGQDMASNVLILQDHLKMHMDNLEVGCNRCVLKFVDLGQLKEHLIRDHVTVTGAQPFTTEEHLITKPKNKPRPPVKDSMQHSVSDTYEDMVLVLPEGMLCRECDTPLDSDKHFLGTSKCVSCPFVTSCYRSQLRHGQLCAGLHSLEDAPRRAPHTSHCVCGYSTAIGTDMLTHLLMCEHKTAYPTEEDAQNNIAKRKEPAAVPEDTTTQAEENAEETPPVEDGADNSTQDSASMADYAPPSVLNTQLSLDDLAPPSVLQHDQNEQELLKDTYDRPLATPRHEDPQYTLTDFEPLPQEPPPQPDFEQL